MSKFDWNDEKNKMLEETRGICFEDILIHIKNGDVIDVIRHPQKERYPNQKIMVINIEEYIYLVPYVKSKAIIFMKTIIPSRKATREYLQ